MRDLVRITIGTSMKFALLMEIYDKGRNLGSQTRIDLIGKFLALSQPDIEKKINWSRLFKDSESAEMVDVVCWGLDEFREGRPFMRNKLSKIPHPLSLPSPVGKFEDGIQWDRSENRVVRVGSVGLRHLFLTRIFELLTEVAPRLRVCERRECRKLFLFHRTKQIYCSEGCAQRIRMQRFLDQKTK